MSAEHSLRPRTSAPPASRSESSPPAAISCRLYSIEPPIVMVAVAGRLTRSTIEGSRDFGNVVRSLAGRPYRVLCDFTQTVTMPEDVCAIFMRGQEFAIDSGMERDAFACTSSVLRLQFVRIARESGRFERLGPLQFFDTVEQARAYLEVPASRTYAIASHRSLERSRAPASRRGSALDAGEGAPSRRLGSFESSAPALSRRAPMAPELGESTPSPRPPPFSLRAAAPSRPHNKG